jgi:hypothetical protein
MAGEGREGQPVASARPDERARSGVGCRFGLFPEGHATAALSPRVDRRLAAILAADVARHGGGDVGVVPDRAPAAVRTSGEAGYLTGIIRCS